MTQQNQGGSGSQQSGSGSGGGQGTPYAFSVSDTTLKELEQKLGSNMHRQDDGTILLNNVVIGNDQSIKKFNDKQSGQSASSRR